MKLAREQVQRDLDALPENYKTADIDKLIKRYIRQKADVSELRPCVLREQQFYRIYYYVSLEQIKGAEAQMAFIHENLFFSDWWHTDILIRYAADIDLERALLYAKEYTASADPFIRRWGYVLFIDRVEQKCAADIFPLFKDDDHYSVQMAQAWLICALAVFEPETVYQWLEHNGLRYNINGKAIQKICDSFRISKEWKERFKSLRPKLKTVK